LVKQPDEMAGGGPGDFEIFVYRGIQGNYDIPNLKISNLFWRIISKKERIQ